MNLSSALIIRRSIVAAEVSKGVLQCSICQLSSQRCGVSRLQTRYAETESVQMIRMLNLNFTLESLLRIVENWVGGSTVYIWSFVSNNIIGTSRWRV